MYSPDARMKRIRPSPLHQKTEIDTNTEIASPPVVASTKTTAPAKTQSQTTTANITSISQKLIDHPLTLWKAADSSYNFYSGDIVNAHYVRESEKILTLTTDNRDSGNLVCKYTIRGELKAEAPRSLGIKDTKTACRNLAGKLDKNLSK